MSGWQPSDGLCCDEPVQLVGADAVRSSDLAEQLEERLALSLRQCATHAAGPLRAVADFARAVRSGELGDVMTSIVCDSLTERMAATPMPDDRREVVDQFLAAIFDGLRP